MVKKKRRRALWHGLTHSAVNTSAGTTRVKTRSSASMENGNMQNGNTYEYDLVTIGAGSGGTRASRFSAQHYGAKVAIVELPFDIVGDDDHGGAGGT